MPVIFDAGLPAGTPSTHVFIVGVGDYLYMPPPGLGAPNALVGAFHPETPVMPQLTSPQPSAQALADWFLANQARLQVPLGTVRLMLGGPPDGATLATVRSECAQWRLKCDEDEGNVAIFSFCGHGVYDQNTDENLLLMQDFGDSSDLFWARAVNFDRFYKAMKSSKALTQVFLVDACRNTPASYMEIPREGLSSLLTSRPMLNSGKNAPILRSATVNQQAWGTPNEPSRFCKILLGCLDHYAATEVGNLWQVTTESLGIALKRIGNPRKFDKNLPFFETGGDSVSEESLVKVESPRAVVKVFFSNGDLGALAGVEGQSGGQAVGPFLGDKEPVEFDLPIGPFSLSRRGLGQWSDRVARPPVTLVEGF